MKPHYKKLSLFLSVVFLGLGCFAFFFLYARIKANIAAAGDANAEWQTKENQREAIQFQKSSIESVAADRAALESHFAVGTNIVPFLDTVESLAARVHATPDVFSVDTLANNTGLMVGLHASGTFDAVYKFLVLLQNSPYEVEFNSVSLEKQDGSDQTPAGEKPAAWQATIKVRLVSFVPQ